jgi:DNA repair protein RadA/Sms
MSKIKSAFYCQNCGTQHSKWMGQCNNCEQWNTIAEEIIEKSDERKVWRKKSNSSSENHLINLKNVEFNEGNRIKTPYSEFNRVLGGGIMPGGVVLLGGEPGIGKSTLLLQMALILKEYTFLYISGEESAQQIKQRAQRIQHFNDNIFIYTETNTQKIFQAIEKVNPQIVIVDSIQTLTTNYIDSVAGTISQIRECTAELIKFSKETQIPIFLVGHITKDGNIAGPKLLEHMVDVVLQFEGDRENVYRLLRANKNRFGNTSELGIFEMNATGLREITNPSEILITKKDHNLSGNAIGITMEGIRPLLIEIQALVSSAVYGMPQRSSTGFDTRRLNMLLAVLEKRAGFRLAIKDVFLNITGGLKITDPSIDLAIVCAILSSDQDCAIPSDTCFCGEVGLSGEIRPVNRIEQRIMEAQKLGYNKIFISKYNNIAVKNFEIEIVKTSKLDEVWGFLG